MKEIMRYLCEYCKKEFKTKDKHYCFKNPENKSCPTCANMDWESDNPNSDYETPHPYCQKAYDEYGYTRLNQVVKNLDSWCLVKGNRICKCKYWVEKLKQ